MAAKKSSRKPKPKSKPESEPEPEPESEALRLRSLAVSRLRSSAFKSALKYARRARRLSPSLPGIDLMVTSLKILRCSPDDHYRVLLLDPLPSPSPSPSLIATRYKTLTLTLTPPPDQSHPSVPGADEALDRLSRSFAFLSDPDRKMQLDDRIKAAAADRSVDSFWTACGTCRLLHEFDRKYVGHRLVCPSCKKTFLAAEVQEDEARVRVTGARSKTRSRPRIPEKTLAEIQMEIAKERANNKKKNGKSIISIKEEEEEEEGLSLMKVEDAEFYNFDDDRAEKCFAKGQVWAIYDDDDGMPRHYGLVDDVVSFNPFRVKMSWLDVQIDSDKASARCISCGRFTVGRKVNIDSVNLFSHVVSCERAAKEIYRIYPKKGSVWALYTEGGEEDRKYEIVVFLTSYSEIYGLSMAYLEKVEGFKTIFKRREIGCHAIRLLEKNNDRLFSHQIPARKLSSEEAENLPKECWELDPASLPSEMLNVKRTICH